MDPDGNRTLWVLWRLPSAPAEVTMLPAGAQAGLWLLLACKRGELVLGQGSRSPSLPAVPQGELARSTLPLGKALLCQPTHPAWKGEAVPRGGRAFLFLGGKLRQARHESELVQLSSQITIERLNMNKCCRFIHNVSFYLWNVSEWSKDTKIMLETLVSQERQPCP